ncbi:bile acid:sodium symporter, partial [Candidatus Parcubacteria bacterium]|nr:bile acid:sodium symporter [Candidatus Parcubacteria bacterium]
MKKIFSVVRVAVESHYIVIGLAFIVGLFYSEMVLWMANWSTFFLALIFFLSSLKIDLKEVKKFFSDIPLLLLVNIFALFVLPIFVYYLFNLLWPSMAVAFLILSAMPVGMTAPLLAEISGGRQSMALVLTVTTSLLAPITVPLIIEVLAGASITVSFWDMFILLATVIYVPFILAQIVKKYWQGAINKTEHSFKYISVILLGLLVVVIVAKQSDIILGGFSNWLYIELLFAFFITLHIFGYFVVFWKKKKDRLTVSVCLTYMNFTLAIELVNNFFTEPNILIPVVFSVIPWAIIFIPFKYWANRL